MKTIFGAIALVTAAPVLAQSAPATESQACHAKHPATVAQPQQHEGHAKHMEAMHKECREMMNKEHAERMSAAKLEKEVNGNGHQGHNH